MKHKSIISESLIESAVNYGIPYNDDFNGKNQEGVGYFQITVKNGRRVSSSKAFLNPVLNNENLHLSLKSHVDSLIIKDKEVNGVKFYDKSKKLQSIQANKEVLLCAGTVGSPNILQRSGIGDSNYLKTLGIIPQVDLKGVGQNLQDHLQLRLIYKVNQPITLNDKYHK